MSKSTGKPIKYFDAKKLRDDAVTFHSNATITAAVKSVGGPLEIFFSNLDCAFVFDKDSLFKLIAKILTVPDSGLVMMMGASDDTVHVPSREHKPTLSIFACKIDKEKDEFEIIHPNPANPDDTDGEEHPGLVNLGSGPILPGSGLNFNSHTGKGGINFLQEQ